MMYDKFLARSFSKNEQRQLRWGAMIASFLIAFSFITVFKPSLDPLQVLNVQLSSVTGKNLQIGNDLPSSFLQVKKEIITENSTLSNDDMISSQEILQKSVTEHLKNANDTPPVVVEDSPYNTEFEKVDVVFYKEIDVFYCQVSETTMNHTEWVDHTSNTQESKIAAETKVKIPLPVNDTIIFQEKEKGKTEARTNIVALPVCNIMERSDFCEMKGDIRIDGNSGTVYIVSSEMDVLAAPNTSWRIRPYGRKGDGEAMNSVREWSVKLVAGHGFIPKCTQNHNAPSILFSLGGYSGNHFHSFADVLIPLFATARPFDRDVEFLISDRAPWLVVKFGKLLKALSRYDFIDIDKKEHIHCFPSITVGLKGRSKKELSIDPANSAYSIKDFRQFLRNTYSLKKISAIRIKEGEKNRPRLLIISRKRTRAFTNVGEISKLAKKLGFRVVVAEPDADVSRFAQLINSCDVVLGVHGAGLTNILFLPENAILIQVVPFGGADWVSKVYFEEPLKDLDIRYLDYKIQVEESTLIQQYPRDHVVFTDPTVIRKQGWKAFKATYLDKQNVKLDINRFRPTLVKALEILRQ